MASYSTIARVKGSLPPAYFQGPLAPTDDHIQDLIDDCSAEADGYIASKYTLPLVAGSDPSAPYDRALMHAVDHFVVWHLLCDRGFNPENPADAAVEANYKSAEKWLERLADGKIKLSSTQGDPPSVQPDVSTSVQRGYGYGTTYDPYNGPNWGI